MSELLVCENLTKSYGNFTAIKDVSFDIKSNSVTALIGPNGAGKTTLYNMISGHSDCTSGEIILQGQNMTNKPIQERANLGVGRTFQINNLFSNLSVRDNLIIPKLANYTGLNSLLRSKINRSDWKHVIDLLKLLDLVEVADAKVNTLSYGYKRRLEIGIALSTNPKILLLDEPTAGMTNEEISQIIKLINRLNRNLDSTIMITEHNIEVVYEVSSRIIVLRAGEIIADGLPNEIRQNQMVKDAYLGETYEQ